MNNEEQPKIVTKRSSSIRFTISTAMGGIGKAEMIIFGIAILFISLSLIFLSKINIFLGISISILLFLFFLFLCFPTRSGQKVYYLIFLSFAFIFKNKKFSSKNNNINIITNNNIIINNQKAIIFKINASDISLANNFERLPIISHFSKTLQILDLNFEIKKINVPYDYNEQKKFLQEQILKLKNEKKLEQLNNQLDLLIELEKNENLKTTHFLIIYGNNFKQINNKIRPILNSANGIIFSPAGEMEVKLLIQQWICPQNINNNINSFSAVQYKKYIKTEKKFISYVTINDYSLLVYDNWLSAYNFDNINYSFKCFNLSQQESLKLLDKAIQSAELQEARKTSENSAIDNYMNNFFELIQLIQQTNQSLKMVSLTFEIFADNKKELDYLKNNLIAELAKNNHYANELVYQQKQAYDHNFIWNNKNKLFWQEMASDTIASAWPFVATPLNDERGILLGTTVNDEPVFFDIKSRNNNRNNSNAAIIGMAGSGKTFLVKKIINWLYSNNTKIFIIDPEREYQGLMKYFNGENILMGSEDSRINPLEIFSDNLTEHLNNLHQWFINLYPDLSIEDISTFQNLVNQLYKKWKIEEDSYFKFKANDYPTFSDLFSLIELKEKNINQKSQLYHSLWMLTNGFQSKMFNGKTTLNLKSDFIIFDTHEIPKNEKIANGLYYLMLSFLDKKIRENKAENEKLPEDKKQWICVAIDEAHTMINQQNLLALNFVYSLAKRIRKYYGILFIITQNVRDFVGTEAIKNQTQAILNNTTYQFVHHLKSGDITDYDDLISPTGRLNEFEINELNNAQRGHNLFIINSQRTILQTEVTELEAINFAKGDV